MSTATIYNAELTPVGSWLILLTSRDCVSGGYIVKVVKKRDDLLGKPFEGSAGEIVAVGEKIPHLGWTLSKVEELTEPDEHHPKAWLRAVVSR